MTSGWPLQVRHKVCDLPYKDRNLLASWVVLVSAHSFKCWRKQFRLAVTVERRHRTNCTLRCDALSSDERFPTFLRTQCLHLEGSPTGPRRRMICTVYPWRYIRRYPLARNRVTSQKNRIVSNSLWQAETSQYTHVLLQPMQGTTPHCTMYSRCSKTAQDICSIYLTAAPSPSAAVTRVTVSHRDYIPQRLTSTDRSISKGRWHGYMCVCVCVCVCVV